MYDFLDVFTPQHLCSAESATFVKLAMRIWNNNNNGAITWNWNSSVISVGKSCKKINIRDSEAVLWQRKSYKKTQKNDQWLCSQLCCISTTAKNIFIFNTWNLMLCIHQFGSLETWITTIQILSIYGKNQPKTELKYAAQNNKLFALSSAEIYRMV